jgi:hypothetical protein
MSCGEMRRMRWVVQRADLSQHYPSDGKNEVHGVALYATRAYGHRRLLVLVLLTMAWTETASWSVVKRVSTERGSGTRTPQISSLRLLYLEGLDMDSVVCLSEVSILMSPDGRQ